MIVYNANKSQFLKDVATNQIHTNILAELKRFLGRSTSESEVSSWRNSMRYMATVLDDDEIPDSSRVAIEYAIPLTSKRIDFIITGKDADKADTAVIVELKQWSKVKTTNKDGIVETFIGGAERETSHPSYQAWSYQALIEDFNQTVRDESISLRPCAYLHNLDSSEAINDTRYKEYLDRAPVFISKDARKLSAFLKRFVKYGDADDVMYRIEHGKIRPSKNLADCLVSMLNDNQEFLMIDDQKLVYETVLDLVHSGGRGEKNVLIVQGGPGTGKSVVAINLLVELTKREFVAQYVSKNSAPREVYKAHLKGSFKKGRIDNLFKGSASYVGVEEDTFDALIIDEAHRLVEKNRYNPESENQVMELIAAAKLSIFFLDEGQLVTWQDIGTVKEIENWASSAGANVVHARLESQFRCNGSDGYLAWVDHALQIRDTANFKLDEAEYEFKVFDDPNEMHEAIVHKNRINNKARLVAGYCWDWSSKKDNRAVDITIPEHNYGAQWNLGSDGMLWIISPDSVREVGCIHTSQGLELDYVGVIAGPDFIVRDGMVVTDASSRSRMDSTIKGYKKMHKVEPEAADQKAAMIIKNTYRTLMTRGQKGCYFFSVDPETNSYIRSLLEVPEEAKEHPQSKYPNLGLQIIEPELVNPYVNSVPIFDLQAAAGDFSAFQNIDEHDWVALPDGFAMKPGLFVAQVVGESMNKKIANGSWCVFRNDIGGSRQGKVVLVQHRDIQDQDIGGNYTVKRYESIKELAEDGDWMHKTIILHPESTDAVYSAIDLDGDAGSELKVIGELVAVLG